MNCRTAPATAAESLSHLVRADTSKFGVMLPPAVIREINPMSTIFIRLRKHA
jgi:hypothetical protein